MNTANLELCKELWRLSGWTTDWHYIAEKNPGIIVAASWREHEGEKYICPAYDLGYLLRKLPIKVKDEYQGDVFGVHLKQTGGTGWIIYYGEPGKSTEMYFNSADTPEDAACKQAIELFKQGVLKKEKP